MFRYTLRRLPFFVAVLVGLTLASTTTLVEAAGSGATRDTFPVSFVMSSPDTVSADTTATCPYLPPGTTLTGSGSETAITTRRTDRQGVETITNATHAEGTATDHAGHQYVFNYSNEFRAANTTAQPNVYSGTMTDAFSLAGNGPANVHNGFLAGITITINGTRMSFSFPIDRQSRGDPIEFPSGAPHCDPL
jgi:hypothetical protein